MKWSNPSSTIHPDSLAFFPLSAYRLKCWTWEMNGLAYMHHLKNYHKNICGHTLRAASDLIELANKSASSTETPCMLISISGGFTVGCTCCLLGCQSRGLLRCCSYCCSYCCSSNKCLMSGMLSMSMYISVVFKIDLLGKI